MEYEWEENIMLRSHGKRKNQIRQLRGLAALISTWLFQNSSRGTCKHDSLHKHEPTTSTRVK